MTNTCPGCSAQLATREPYAWAVVCSSCSALVLDNGSRFPGATIDMPLVEDLSPFRIGCVGQYMGAHLRIVGRVRVESRQGYRNYWSVRGDIPFRWIAQSFGGYVLLNKWNGILSKEDVRGIRPLHPLRLANGDAYTVEMLDGHFRYAWEGQLVSELPMPWEVEVEAGRPPDGKVLLLIDRSKNVTVFEGKAVDFAELHLENPPALARWT